MFRYSGFRNRYGITKHGTLFSQRFGRQVWICLWTKVLNHHNFLVSLSTWTSESIGISTIQGNDPKKDSSYLVIFQGNSSWKFKSGILLFNVEILFLKWYSIMLRILSFKYVVRPFSKCLLQIYFFIVTSWNLFLRHFQPIISI